MNRAHFKLVLLWILSFAPRRASRWLLIRFQKKNDENKIRHRFTVLKIFFDFIAAKNIIGRHDVVLEFGAGKDCIGSLACLSLLGKRSLYSVDIEKQLDTEQFDTVRNFIAIHHKPTDIGHFEYLAPFDLRKNWPVTRSPNIVFSINTMEHIPKDDIIKIADNVFKNLPVGGIFVNLIDYSDHSANVSDEVSEYNFYRYGSLRWNLFNPPLHFQNRLRHGDYIRLLECSGFEVTEDVRLKPDDANDKLGTVPLTPFFERYSKADLITTAGYIVARRPY